MKLWDRSVEFKLLAGYSLVAITLISTLIIVLQIQLRSKLEEETLKQVDTNGEIIVSELVNRTTLVNTLAQNIVSFSVSTNQNSQLIKKTLPQLIDLHHSEVLIAGGGYWPEPFAFDPKQERNSFFWGRNQQGVLEYYNDYNLPTGPGYHNEEWYVPARHLPQGSCYWSRSYTDPYSGQPMVTCTVAAKQQGQFIGAATIDLKLEGLTEILAQHTQSTGGYAFAVDQHNRFISFPNQSMISQTNNGERITAQELAEKDSRFNIVATALAQLSDDITKNALNNQLDNSLAQKISEASYQISPDEGSVIAAALNNPLQNSTRQSLLLKRIDIDNDLLIEEPSTLSIFHVPHAYWKVVVVTPKRVAFSSVQQLIEETLKALLLPLLIILAIAFIGMRTIVLKPISNITTALKKSVESDGFHFHALDEQRNDEFGQLAHWYNRKNIELNEAMNKLSDMNSELTYHANCDALTSLSNRRDFEHKLQALITSEQWNHHSLFYLDMDQFKLINDTCGHVAGDQLLIQISHMLRRLLRGDDSVARIGGDEFAIIANTPNRQVVISMAERIIKNMSNMVFSWENANFNITCSIGALYLADIDPDATQAMKNVDTACYAAKEAGRNRYHLYQHNDLASRRAGEMNWIARINNAFDNDLFVSEFQIIAPTNMNEGNLNCLESLVRMKDTDGSLIPPGAFLPAAERYNNVARIDRWVIDNTMRILSENKAVLDKIRFCSINLSGDSICSNDLTQYIVNRLEKYQIPPQQLCFEITETQAMLNINQARVCLDSIRQIGCLIALDDFGSGMSSYGYLTDMPVNFLKIDGSFVRDIATDNIHLAFVKSMGDIATAMGLETIAEFVEDLNTYHLLKQIGIDYTQGYGIAKPQPIAEVITFLHDDTFAEAVG